MSYTVVLTMTKTADSPADAFDTIPVLAKFATAGQIATFNAAYPNTTSVNVVDENQRTLTSVFASQAVWEAQRLDPLWLEVKAQKDAWAEANHITMTLEKF